MDGNVENRWRIIDQIKSVTKKYQKLIYWQTVNGNFILQGRLEFFANENGHIVKDAFDIKILVPADYPNSLARVWEIGNRIPKRYHINPDSTLCIGTQIEVEYALSDNNSLIEFVEQILIKYLFGFAVWERTGKFLFGERKHGAEGILEFYQIYFNVKDFESAKRLLYYLSSMKRYSRKKWCPCKSSRRMRHCHGEKIKHILSVSSRSRFRDDYEACRIL